MNEREIFIDAMQIDTPAGRQVFLEQACGGDSSLRERLETLLRAHEKGNSFLEAPPPGVDAAIQCPGSAEQPGQTIGRYKLLELIGEGGFGNVYMAAQTEPVCRQVALKVIKLGMDTKQVIARFEAERQALAMMDHPNIAKVLDAGAADSGRPYFVMELLRGVPITEYCDSNTLTTKARLKLFVTVCHAVLHAHQKGIIHRDIKPTNVMVTLHDGQPVPKVIDFGIAKATQQRLTERTVSTGHGQMIGTPQYMSPEQAEMCDQDIDTRTDIYSLGVLLYELLVGTTPFEPDELRSVGYDQMCRIIRENNPPTPSRRLSTLGDLLTTVSQRRQVQPAVLRKQLQGDLDWIVMKALEKDRTRRYETVNALALDTERYLNEEPVLARAPSAIYRFKKYIRKHRAPVAAATSILAALICGLILATIGFVRADGERRIATSERDRADKHAAKAEALTRQTRQQLYVSDVNSAYHAWEEGNTDRVRELLNRHVPQPGEEDLRGFEWRYLWGDYQRALAIVTLQHASITSVAFSPDSAIVASAGYDNRVKLWDVSTQTELRALEHEKGILCVAFSPDGNILACGSQDHTVKFWDVATGNLIATLPHNQEVASVAFSPDGETLAAGCGAFMVGEIRLWNVVTRAEIATLSGHTARVSAVAFSPDGGTLVSGSWDRTVKLWDVDAGVIIKTLQGHTNRIYAVTFSPDGRTLASGSASSDSSVKLWDMATHTVTAQLGRPFGSVNSLAFSPNGATLAVGSQDCRVWLWDLATKKIVPYFSGHSSCVRSLAFSPDGTTLASGSNDGTIKIAEVAPFRAESNDEGHSDWLTRIAISSTDGEILAVGSGEMVTESRSGEILLWDVATQEKRSLTGEDTGPVYGVALSPDGQVLATGGMLRRSWTGVLRLWDVPSGKLLRTLKDHTGGVFSLAFSPDGKTLASGDWGRPDAEAPDSEDRGATIRLWDVATGELRESLPTERFAATSIAFAPGGERLAIGGGRWDEGEIKLWDATSHKAPVTLAGPSGMVWDVVFSPDGKTLAAADYSGGVTLWDVVRGRKELTIKAHSHRAFSVAFAPHGKTLASGSLDNTVKLWHVATGDELATLKAHVPITSVAFLPDGNTLVAGGTDKSVTLWHVDAEKEVLRAGSK